MNLLNDIWLPVIRKNKDKHKIAIWQILDNYKNNPVTDIEAPRPDFRNAIYQLLIGIVQVAAMPEDEEEWDELWSKPYSQDEFKNKLLKYKDCFEIDTDGPAFMQDFENLKDKKYEKPIAKLLMGSPGDNTIKLNIDHFIKNDESLNFDIYWSSVSLFVLQTFGPPDGGGHREGLRGSGPLNCLLIPYRIVGVTSLWEKIWLNIFPREEINGWNGNKNEKIFPWMKPTIISKDNRKTYFNNLHPLSVYWSMPRRIRLNIKEKEDGNCSLTNYKSINLIKYYYTKKHGIMYSNLWQHPFSPYSKKNPDIDNNKKLTLRAYSRNFTYKNWVPLVIGDERYIQAKIVEYFINKRIRKLTKKNISISLWASGFDIEPGKATVNNWNEALMPLFSISSTELEKLREVLDKIILFINECVYSLIFSIKRAWFKSPGDVKGDFSFIDTAFWHNTESGFYNILAKLVENINDNKVVSECASEWLRIIRKQSLELFDTWALSEQEEGINMKRVVRARNMLLGSIKKIADKHLKNFIAIE